MNCKRLLGLFMLATATALVVGFQRNAIAAGAQTQLDPSYFTMDRKWLGSEDPAVLDELAAIFMAQDRLDEARCS